MPCPNGFKSYLDIANDTMRVTEFWHQHFGQVFFRTWSEMGFPDPGLYGKTYVQIREHNALDTKWLEEFAPGNGEITLVKLRSVFGFGAVISHVFSELLDVKEIHREKIALWCGHFNLGISLYDYICDELGNFSSLISLETLRSFETEAFSRHRPESLLERLLSKIVQLILDDDQISQDPGNENQTPLFDSIRSLYEAENFLIRNKMFSHVATKKLEEALRIKSAGPFRLMAQYCASSASPGDREMLAFAGDMGLALGHCYWLIDDARDLWDDLKVGHGNLFLLAVYNANNEFVQLADNASTRQCLVDHLVANKLAERFSQQFLKAFKKSLENNINRDIALGLVGASLWHWYMY